VPLQVTWTTATRFR